MRVHKIKGWNPQGVKTTAWVLLLVWLGVGAAWGQAPQAPEKSISLDSGMGQPNNRAVGHLGIEMLESLGALSDSTGNWAGDSYMGLLLKSYTEIYATYYVTSRYALVYHEMGHASRCQAMGASTYYTFLNETTPRYNNVYSYFLAAMSKNYDGGLTWCSGGAVPATAPADFAAIVGVTGGMNNSMYFSEQIEDEIYFNGGHWLWLFPYLSEKMDAANYVSVIQNSTVLAPGTGDPEVIQQFYAGKGYAITLNDMKQASLNSLAGSATAWMLLYKTLIHNDDTAVRAFDLGVFDAGGQEVRWRLPDTEMYFTTRGLSYKVRSAFRWGDWYFPFALETVTKGGSGSEVSMGVVKKDKQSDAPLEYSVMLIGPNLETYVRWDYLTLGLSHHHVASLHGERQIMDLTKRNTNQEFWLRVSYYY